MKIILPLVSIILLECAAAFNVVPSLQRHAASKSMWVLSESTVSDVEIIDTEIGLKQDLLDTAERLKSEYGVLVIDKTAQDELKAAVKRLEAALETEDEEEDSFPVAITPEKLVGDWTLVCSTASADLAKKNGKKKSNGFAIDTTKLPFVKDIRTLLNQSLQVQQRILKDEEDTSSSETFNRIEHVLEYKPPSKLEEFLKDVPDVLKSLDLNPLQVSAGKVTLVHKAEVESTIPTLKTKLSLSSVVVNVAGKSQILEPEGADVLGINVPLGEFLNAGSFETTYMDEDLRISRSKVGIIDQLRVFVRTPVEVEEEIVEDEVTEIEATDEETTEIVDVVETEVVEDAEEPEDDVSPSDVE